MTDYERVQMSSPFTPGETYRPRPTLLAEKGLRTVSSTLRPIRLQAITAALAEAVTVADVVAVILDHAATSLGATAGIVVAVAPEDGELVRLGQVGCPPEAPETDGQLSSSLSTTLSKAVRTAAPVYLAPADERTARLLGVADRRPVSLDGVLVALPLRVRGRTIGAIGLRFVGTRTFDADDRATLLMLAQQCAIALEGARLYDAEQAARQDAERKLPRPPAAPDKAEAEDNQLIAAITHDLKNPLTVIRAQAQIAQVQLSRSNPDPATIGQRLATIVATTGRMTAMLDGLLDSARLGMGQQLPLDRQPVELVALAQRAIAAQSGSAQGRLCLAASVSTLTVAADPLRMERVLDNLLTNALKFSPAGGAITLSVDCGDDREQHWAELTVRDEGLGIPATDLPHIFERFRRGSNVVGRIKGTGIGLGNARQIVEAHGGTLTVVSEEGLGTTVRVRLPLDR